MGVSVEHFFWLALGNPAQRWVVMFMSNGGLYQLILRHYYFIFIVLPHFLSGPFLGPKVSGEFPYPSPLNIVQSALVFCVAISENNKSNKWLYKSLHRLALTVKYGNVTGEYHSICRASQA